METPTQITAFPDVHRPPNPVSWLHRHSKGSGTDNPLHPLPNIDKIERTSTMATSSFATVTNTAQRIPFGFTCLVPATPYRELVAKTTSLLPISAAAFNLQYLLDNFTPGKSRREHQPLPD